jgi:hypothetical protein
MNFFDNFTVRDRLLFSGNALMLLTCLLYIAWWTSAFRPGSRSPAGVSSALLVCTLAAGIASIVQLVRGIRIRPSTTGSAVSTGGILLGAVILYGILLVVSRSIFHRPVTSELFIMILWAAGELCVLFVLHQDGRFGRSAVILLLALIAAATVAGFICYLKYYHLEGTASFVDGLLPLAFDAAVIAVFLVLHAAAVIK